MRKRGANVRPHFSPHFLVSAAERIVLGQEPLGGLVNTARKDSDVIIHILPLDIVDREKLFLVVVVHLFQHLALHHQETRRDVENLDKPVDRGLVGEYIYVEIEPHLANILGGPLRNFILHEFPVDGFLGVYRGRDVLVELEQADHGRGVEPDICVDEHHVRKAGVHEEAFDEDVPGALDERLVPHKVHVYLDAALRTQSLKRNQTGGEAVAHHASIAGDSQENMGGFLGGCVGKNRRGRRGGGDDVGRRKLDDFRESHTMYIVPRYYFHDIYARSPQKNNK